MSILESKINIVIPWVEKLIASEIIKSDNNWKIIVYCFFCLGIEMRLARLNC